MSTFDLDDALAKGLISEDQYEALRAEATRVPASGEPVRVVNRFSEVFLSIGLLIAATGVSSLTEGEFARQPGLITLAWIALSAVAAEVFWRSRGARLPVITAGLMAAYAAYAGLWQILPTLNPRDLPIEPQAVPYLGVLAVLSAWLARYRIPFLIGPIGVTVALIAVLGSGWFGNALLVMLGVAGAGFLAAAVWLDRADPKRTGQASQHAFWAYLVGSPMLLHPIFITLILRMSAGAETLSMTGWAILVGTTVLVTVLGLLLDRRAPVNSTFIYIALITGQVTHNVGMTSLVIGLYILILGFAWERLRRSLLTVHALRTIAPDRAYLASPAP